MFTVFDFDDTLFPTAFFSDTTKFSYPKKEELKNYFDNETLLKFNKIEKNISELFSFFKKYCGDNVFIITNANEHWIQYCFATILTEVSANSVKLFCLQDLDENYTTKKTVAFDKILSPFFLDEKQKFTLISFGDSAYDRSASISMKTKFKNLIVKNVLFKHMPELDDLISEQNLIIKTLDDLIKYEGDLDLVIA